MTSHLDPHKMTKPELRACGCDRCQDALRTHDALDALIASQDKTRDAIERLERSVDSLTARPGSS